MPSANQPLSVRRPALFGCLIAVAAVILVFGIAAAFGVFGHDEEGESLLGLAEARIGVVRVEGPINDAEEVVAFIRKLREDDTVKGVILRINSPGGAFGPSQEMYMAVKKLAAKKLVVASPVAAVGAVDKLHILADELHILDVKENYMGTDHYYDDNTIPSHEETIEKINQIILNWQ